MACRSERRSAWRMLAEPNPLLWAGLISELLLVAALLLLPQLGGHFGLGPFPVAFLPWMALVPPLIVLCDDLRKQSPLRGARPARHPGGG